MSTILPFPSSPHWAPTIATTDMTGLVLSGEGRSPAETRSIHFRAALEERSDCSTEGARIPRQRLTRAALDAHERCRRERDLDQVRIAKSSGVGARIALWGGGARDAALA